MAAKKNVVEETVTGPELAEWLGISLKAVVLHAGSGVLVREARGRYKLKRSVQGYCAHLLTAASGRGSPTALARTQLLQAQAQLAKTKAANAAGLLIDVAAVEAKWTQIARVARNGMAAVPTRCASRLPHLTAADVVELDKEVREALTELSDAA